MNINAQKQVNGNVANVENFASEEELKKRNSTTKFSLTFKRCRSVNVMDIMKTKMKL